MDTLWAPWRLSYVTMERPTTGADECFICRAKAGTDDRASLLVGRGPHSVVLLNRFPYNNGHVLVCPATHKAHLHDLTTEELADNMAAVRAVMRALDEIMKPNGYNVGLNLGSAAGAGLPGHLHWHVVPRWTGDTNFMPVVGDVRVVSQALEALFDLLAPRVAAGW